MDKKYIETMLKESIADIMDMDENEINTDDSLREIGANSVDRMEIIVDTMKKIDLKVNMVEFADIKNIQGIIDFLYSKKND